MKINQKLKIEDSRNKLNDKNVSLVCKEVLNTFYKNSNYCLTIRDVSSSLSISYQTAKHRLHKLVNIHKIKRVYSGAYCLPENLTKINLFPFHVRMNKHFTITVPSKIIKLRNLKNQFVKILIEKNNIKSIFLTRTYYNSYSRQTYAFINAEIRKKLNINPNDRLKIVNMDKISQFKIKKEIFYNAKVDILSLIPEKSKKGFDFFVEEFEENNEDWLNIWYYSTNCGSKNIWIKRFVNSEKLGCLLGIFQAEGTKFEEIKNNQSPRLVFTNKSIQEHKRFINTLNDFGISKDLIKVNAYYNPINATYKEYKAYIDKFEESVGIKPKTNIYTNQEKLYYCIQITIDRSALAELFLNAMHRVRSAVANNESNDVLQELGRPFLAKLLTGDGCLVTVKDKKKGNYVTQGYISDKNKAYREDYRKILKNFGISVANWDDGKRVYFKCSNENLKFLYKIKAFKGTRSWKKLIRAMFYKQQNKTLYERFKKLSEIHDFTNKQFANIFKVSLKAAILWLRDKRKKGYIKILKIGGNRHYYTLSEKAKDLINFFDKCKSELKKDT